MAIIEIPTKTETSLLGGLGGATPQTGSDILLFFRELRAFLEISVVQDLIRQKANIPVGGGDTPTGGGGTPDIGSGVLRDKNGKERKGGEIINNTAVKTPEEIVIEQLATPEGRKSLAEGVKNIIAITGDIKLSEVIIALTEGDKKK